MSIDGRRWFLGFFLLPNDKQNDLFIFFNSTMLRRRSFNEQVHLGVLYLDVFCGTSDNDQGWDIVRLKVTSF